MSDQLDFKYLSGLVRQVQAGDSNAFAELFAATHQTQYAFAYGYLADALLAREALQETYVYALKNLTKLQDPLLVIAWLNQRNLAICLRLRARQALEQAQRQGLPLPPEADPERLDVEIEGERFLVRLIMQLPFTQSQTILLKYLCNMSIPSIADLLSLRKSEVRRHIANGCARLKSYYSPNGGMPS